jgi:hypothetical protein
MYPRTEYEMTQADLEELLAVMKPVPVMMIGGYSTSETQQRAANAAWQNLGVKMGFDHMTVRPVDGKGQRFFSAIPSETDETRRERLAREARDKRQAEIDRLHDEIGDREEWLTELLRQ